MQDIPYTPQEIAAFEKIIGERINASRMGDSPLSIEAIFTDVFAIATDKYAGNLPAPAEPGRKIAKIVV